jgi:hypothetical protein
MAPMADSPAPARNDWAAVLARIWSNRATKEDEDERGGEGDQRSEQGAGNSTGCVADYSDRLDDRSGSELAESDGVEELRAGHPVVGGDGVVLHERTITNPPP